jgi:hypothetical protein
MTKGKKLEGRMLVGRCSAACAAVVGERTSAVEGDSAGENGMLSRPSTRTKDWRIRREEGTRFGDLGGRKDTAVDGTGAGSTTGWKVQREDSAPVPARASLPWAARSSSRSRFRWQTSSVA